MFTGIVKHRARVLDIINEKETTISLCLSHDLPRLESGDSIALNGVCLTAIVKTSQSCIVNISSETLERSTLGYVALHQQLHLESPLTLATPLGGHIVTGHIDEVLSLAEVVSMEDYRLLTFSGVSHPEWLIEKGSVAIDGVSLTVNSVDDLKRQFSCMLIPRTLSETHFADLSEKDEVNVEYDYLAKIVAKHALSSYLKFDAEGASHD